MDPHSISEDAMHVVLHSWITTYLRTQTSPAARIQSFSGEFQVQTERLRQSAQQLQAALEKMRLANERLAARMAEHKAFFAKYQSPQ